MDLLNQFKALNTNVGTSHGLGFSRRDIEGKTGEVVGGGSGARARTQLEICPGRRSRRLLLRRLLLILFWRLLGLS